MANDFFISYRRTNQPLASKLAEALSRHGSAVWWDAGISPGEEWGDEIADGLEESDVFVILFSAECNDSKPMKKELAAADFLDKVIVPVLIEDAKPKGRFLYELACRQWIQIYPEPEEKVEKLASQLVNAFCERLRDSSDLTDEPGAQAAELKARMEGLQPPMNDQPVARAQRRFYSSTLPLILFLGLIGLGTAGFREKAAAMLRPVSEFVSGANPGLVAAVGAGSIAAIAAIVIWVRRRRKIRELEANFRHNLRPL